MALRTVKLLWLMLIVMIIVPFPAGAAEISSSANSLDRIINIFTAPFDAFLENLMISGGNVVKNPGETFNRLDPRAIGENADGRFKEVTGISIIQFVRAVVGLFAWFFTLVGKFFGWIAAFISA